MSLFSRDFIPYYPKLSSKFGSVTSAILFAKLEHLFAENSNEPFHKFLKPCEHKEYEKGESWIEELGMTETEFRTAFSKIGVAYKSKKEFDNSDDKFQGKCYCSYIDRIERKTYYFINKSLFKKDR